MTTTKPMDDRELLELAAKAAGVPVDMNNEGGIGWFACGSFDGETVWWNPLKDDGDALRLAVKLGMRVSINSDATDVYDGERSHLRELYYGNAHAATRRAIVRAAAEIARQEKDHDR